MQLSFCKKGKCSLQVSLKYSKVKKLCRTYTVRNSLASITMEASIDGCKSDPAEASTLESLLINPDESICSSSEDPPLQNEEEFKDLSVVDEITVTTETSLSDVISSSLQAIDGTAVEDIEPFTSVYNDSCEAGDPGVACEGCDLAEPVNTSIEEDGQKVDSTESLMQTQPSEVLEEPSTGQAMEDDGEMGSWTLDKKLPLVSEVYLIIFHVHV